MQIKKKFTKTKKFLKENKWCLLQIGIYVLLPTVNCFATSYEGLPIEKGVKTFETAMTGAIPKAGVTIAASSAAIGWAMGMDNQIVKMGVRFVGGGGVAMAAPSFIEAVTDTTKVSGCLFM